jgi:RNase P protein component
MREAWRKLLRHAPEDMWFVCVARRGAAGVKSDGIMNEIRDLLSRAPWTNR